MKTFGPGGSFGNPLNVGTPAGRRNAGGYCRMKQQELRRQQQRQQLWQQQQPWTRQQSARPALPYQQPRLSYPTPSPSAPVETGRSGKWIFFILLAIVLFILVA
jgi:hypothetical protein